MSSRTPPHVIKAEEVEQRFKEARARLSGDDNKNIYCPFCDGLVWAPVPYVPAHFASCPHYHRSLVLRGLA